MGDHGDERCKISTRGYLETCSCNTRDQYRYEVQDNHGQNDLVAYNSCTRRSWDYEVPNINAISDTISITNHPI
jgi:hypothetical protein